MPVGPYKTFGECTTAQMKKGKDKESANKICGEMESRTQKATESIHICDNGAMQIKQTLESIEEQTGLTPNQLFDPSIDEQDKNKYEMMNPQYNNNDRYFVKAFLFSPSINLNDWGVTMDSLPKNIYSFMGKPIVLTEDFTHPDNGLEYDTVENTLKFQEDFKIGTIIDIVHKDNIYYAIAEITSKEAKQMFRDNKMPTFVSPAIGHNENTTRKSNWVGLHLAIVKSPAFTTQKALIKGTCSGSEELCMIQLATASLDIQKEDYHSKITPVDFDIQYVLSKYKENIDKLAKHNVINFNTQNRTNSNIKMTDNGNSTTTIQTNKESVDTNKPSQQVNQKNEYFDLNMCVANFVERGLDPNTAKEICITAAGSENGGMGAEGGQQGAGNPARGANPSAGYSSGNKDIFDNPIFQTMTKLLNTKNYEINQYQNKLQNYETQFQEQTGLKMEKDVYAKIKSWHEIAQKQEAEAKQKQYEDFLKLYNNNLEEIKAMAKVYNEVDFPMEKLKQLYEGKEQVEQQEKTETKTETETPTSETETTEKKEVTKTSESTSTKPHEMFNTMKENNGYTTKTQDNRMVQKSTASTKSENSNGVNNLLLETFTPRYSKDTSNNQKEGEL